MSAILQRHDGDPVRIAVFGTHPEAVREVSQAAASRLRATTSTLRMGGITVNRVVWNTAEGRPCLLRALVSEDHPSALDLAVRESDAVLFVMDVEASQLKAGWNRLMLVGDAVRREGHELLDRPFAIQYHRAELHAGFDAALMDGWLGFPLDRVIRTVSSSDRPDEENGALDRLVFEVLSSAGSGPTDER